MVSDRREHVGIKSTKSSSFHEASDSTCFAGMMKDGEKVGIEFDNTSDRRSHQYYSHRTSVCPPPGLPLNPRVR